jgi:hypothetical protein
MSVKWAATWGAASMMCAVTALLSGEPDNNLVIRDDNGVSRVVVGERADGAWGIEINGPDGRARASIGYSDASGTAFAVFVGAAAEQGVAITVSDDPERSYVQVGPRFARGEGTKADAIVLESQGGGLNSIGVFAAPQKPRIVLESQDSQSALIITGEDFRPRTAVLRRQGKYGWAIWGADGSTKARVADTAAGGLEVDLGR